jgi:hypothetical protein
MAPIQNEMRGRFWPTCAARRPKIPRASLIDPLRASVNVRFGTPDKYTSNQDRVEYGSRTLLRWCGSNTLAIQLYELQ